MYDSRIPILFDQQIVHTIPHELQQLYNNTLNGSLMYPTIPYLDNYTGVIQDEYNMLSRDKQREIFENNSDKKALQQTVMDQDLKHIESAIQGRKTEEEKQMEYYREYPLDDRLAKPLEVEAIDNKDNYIGTKSQDFVKGIRQSGETYQTAKNFLNLPSKTGTLPRETLEDVLAERLTGSNTIKREALRRKRELFTGRFSPTQEEVFTNKLEGVSTDNRSTVELVGAILKKLASNPEAILKMLV